MRSLKHYLMCFAGNLLRSRASKVLYYHDVFEAERYTPMGTPVELFCRHMDTVRNAGFSVVREISEPENQVQICFDDGFRGIWDTRAVLADYGVEPTIFCAVSLIGKPGYLTVAELKELCARQNWRVQSHTWSHQDLTKFHGESLRHELSDARRQLSECLDAPMDELCFPIGYYSDEVLREAWTAGYRKLYCSIPGDYGSESARGIIRRNLVQHVSPEEVRWILAGGLTVFAGHYRKLHWKNAEKNH